MIQIKKGDTIYIPDRAFLSSEDEKCEGGKAIIHRIEIVENGLYGKKTHYIHTKEMPDVAWAWEFLEIYQDDWKKEFGNKKAKQRDLQKIVDEIKKS